MRKDLPSPISLMVFVHFLDGLEDFNSSHQLLTKHQIWDPNQVYQLHQDLKKILSLSFFHEKKTPISASNYKWRSKTVTSPVVGCWPRPLGSPRRSWNTWSLPLRDSRRCLLPGRGGIRLNLGRWETPWLLAVRVVVFPLPRFTMTTCFMRSFRLHHLEALILKYDNLLMVGISKFWE